MRIAGWHRHSGAFEAIHASAAALRKVGAIERATLREFDESRLTSLPMIGPKQIKLIREAAHVCQPVFARYLNNSESTVQTREAGAKCQSCMALKLLAVEKHGLKVLT